MKLSKRRQFPRPKFVPPPVQPRTNGEKSRYQQIYEAYENSFNEATENALKSPLWKGLPKAAMQNIKGNTIVFPLNKNFSLMISVAIEQRWDEDFQSERWWWKTICCLIINATKKIHKTTNWTRKDKLRMMNVSNAMIWPLGEGEPTWAIKENLVVFSKLPSEEDIAVLSAVRMELIGQIDPSSPYYGITVEQVEMLGVQVSQWKWQSCTMEFGVGEDWATLYSAELMEKNQGHATYLLQTAKTFYELQTKRFGGSAAIHPAMEHIYEKLNIYEYGDDSAEETDRVEVGTNETPDGV